MEEYDLLLALRFGWREKVELGSGGRDCLSHLPCERIHAWMYVAL